jgi:hypothetical protein
MPEPCTASDRLMSGFLTGDISVMSDTRAAGAIAVLSDPRTFKSPRRGDQVQQNAAPVNAPETAPTGKFLAVPSGCRTKNSPRRRPFVSALRTLFCTGLSALRTGRPCHGLRVRPTDPSAHRAVASHDAKPAAEPRFRVGRPVNNSARGPGYSQPTFDVTV